MALYTFDSVEDFARQAAKLKSYSKGASDWTAYTSYDDCVKFAIEGNDKYVETAQKLIDQLDVELPETKAFRVIRSPFGGRVNFSDWQRGLPDPMRRKVKRVSDTNELKIVVSTTSSASVNYKDMEKRGTAILALLLKLQTVRPIQLYLLSELSGNGWQGWHHALIRVESQPLAVGVAAFALCNVGFARHLTHEFARVKDGSSCAWPEGYVYGDSGDSKYIRKVRARCNLRDDDLYIKSVYSGDLIVRNSVAWVKDALEKYANLESEET